MRRLSFLFVAFMVALASGCATTSTTRSPYSGEQLKNLGEKALSANDMAASLKYLTAAEQQRPRDASIEYDLALAYNQRGFKDQALQHIQKALEIKPDYPEALNTEGYIYATSGRFDLARADFLKAMNDPIYQTPQLAALNLGRLYEDRGDYQSALSYYRQAAKLKPDYAQAWLQAGKVLERTGRNDEAKSAYETALRASPDMAEAWLRLGVMSYNAGDIKEAAGSFAQVQRLVPDTDLANQAQDYLQKINASGPPAVPFRHRSSRLENKKADQQKIKAGPAASQSANTAANQGAPGDANGAAQGSAPAVSEPKAFRYIVVVGAYTDRAKAEELKSGLCGKGYHAVVRHGRGRSYVVQLQAVNTYSKASTLAAQIAGETDERARVVKMPAR